MQLAYDPHAVVVVVDIPDGAAEWIVEELARILPPGDADLRLVFGRTPPGGAGQVARRLSHLLRRSVVTAVGRPWPTADGALFISADRGPGWIRHQPSGQELSAGRRFPLPEWEWDVPDQPFALSKWATAEPIPAGLWVRPVQETPATEQHRAVLMRRLRARHDFITVVLGAPGSESVSLEDIASLWRALPGHIRLSARCLSFGPVDAPEQQEVPEALAYEICAPIRWYTGFPVAGRGASALEAGSVLAVHGDGSLGRPLMTREVIHHPPQGPGRPRPPLVTEHGWPIDHFPLVSPGIYWHGPDTLLEVTSRGLWVRGSQEVTHGDGIRRAPHHADHELVMYDAVGPSDTRGLQWLALQIAERVASDLNVSIQPVGAGAVGGQRDEPEQHRANGGFLPSAEDGGEPARRLAEPGQTHLPTDGPTGAGGRTLEDELRVAFGQQYETSAKFIGALLRREPSLLRDLPGADAATELTALRLHLLAEDLTTLRQIPADSAVRGAVSQALVGGWHRLPAFRGPVAVRATLDENQLSWYSAQQTVFEGGWCAATFSGPPGREGNTEILILSAQGRRTAVLECGDPDWVLFRPGTRFVVLSVEAGSPNSVLLREIAPGAGMEARADRMASRELRRSLVERRRDHWTGVQRSAEPGALFRPPGWGEIWPQEPAR
ncbi:hypothetical protein [Streptomyces bauhiniae]|uniref:hypothetical protein n=1 Tax=Streptomyces bauhiniae TaxID=2340725 RepID=UPI0035D79396